MGKVIEFTDIVERGNEIFSMSCKPDFKKLPEGFITDEDKSVKWNREQVELNHKKYSDEVNRLNTLKNSKRDELYEDIYATIQDSVGNGFTREQAMVLWDYAYSEGHAYGMGDIVSTLRDVIDLVERLNEAGKRKRGK